MHAFLIFLSTFVITTTTYAAAYEYNHHSDLVGELQYHSVRSKDTWESIGYHYDVGYDELRNANPHVRSLKSYIGKTLIIPSLHVLPEKKDRYGIVVNLAEKRLYYFPEEMEIVYTYPISVGKSGWETPMFQGRLVRKKIAPTWYVPKSIAAYYKKKYNRTLPRYIGPGPKNPLGNYALYTSKGAILIHGTNKENLIGRAVSSGCIRMYNRNIQELFYLVKVKDQVHFLHVDEKLGLDSGLLYLEKHQPYFTNDTDSLDDQLEDFEAEYNLSLKLDKDKVIEQYDVQSGVPNPIGHVNKSE